MLIKDDGSFVTIGDVSYRKSSALIFSISSDKRYVSIIFRNKQTLFIDFIDYLKAFSDDVAKTITFNDFKNDVMEKFELSGDFSENELDNLKETIKSELSNDISNIVSGSIDAINTSIDSKLEDVKSLIKEFPKPILHVDKITMFGLGRLKTYKLDASYMTYDIQVSIQGQDVVTRFINSNTIEIDISSGMTSGEFDLTITNKYGQVVYEKFFNLLESTWYDLREGGDNLSIGTESNNDVVIRDGMICKRDVDGMYFLGIQRWQTYAKFMNLKWNRSENKSIEFIMTNPQGAMMLGIGSNERNISSNAQYREHEMLVYYNNQTTLWGLYSNTGSNGSVRNSRHYTRIQNNMLYKTRIENNGVSGSKVIVTMLDKNEKWDSDGVLVKEITIPYTFTPKANEIFPILLPFSGEGQRILGLKID